MMNGQAVIGSINKNTVLFIIGALLLAYEPLIWLVSTWLDPVYDSQGLVVFAVVAGLFLWSISSPRISPNQHTQHALVLLLITASVRLAGQLLAINTLSALTLIIDVYALGILAGLAQRQRRLASGWLAILFAFTLPLERIVQRSIGFALQQLSADGACSLLTLLLPSAASVQCSGVRILLNGQDVLVDLPCSGARSLLLILMLFTALAAIIRPTYKQASIGLGITLIAALISNCIRITILAVGIGFPAIVGIPVMASPWHDLIGLVTLALAALPIFYWAWRCYLTAKPVAAQVGWKSMPVLTKSRYSIALGGGFVLMAVLIIILPAQPVDISRQLANPVLPGSLAGIAGQPDVLSDQEQMYFTRYGGGAARSHYGGFSLLVVETTAPLRHLHAPDECLTGIGHQVNYQGLEHDQLPTAIYRSTDTEGNDWRIAVTYVDAKQRVATSVAEVVWYWFQEPSSSWTMVQRITPWQTPTSELTYWDQAVSRALDLPLSSSSTAIAGIY